MAMFFQRLMRGYRAGVDGYRQSVRERKAERAAIPAREKLRSAAKLMLHITIVAVLGTAGKIACSHNW